MSFEPREEHRHGAAPDCFLTNLAMQQVDGDGNAVAREVHVTTKGGKQSG